MVTRALVALALAGCAGSQAAKVEFHPNADGSPTPPVIVDPKPNAVIVDVRPPITLALPPGTAMAQVEICTDSHCEKTLVSVERGQVLLRGLRVTPKS